MKKLFSLMASIVCFLAIFSSPILSSTPKEELESGAYTKLVGLLTNTGFEVISQDYPDTMIAQSMIAKASRPVSLDAFPSLTSYYDVLKQYDVLNHRVLIPTFTVDSAQLPSFQKMLPQFQSNTNLSLTPPSITPGGDGVFQATKGWTPHELDLFKSHFASLSKSIHVQTIRAFLPLLAADRAKVFYVHLKNINSPYVPRLKELGQLYLVLEQMGFNITINSQMQAQSNFFVSLKNFSDLSFYKDKLVFTFVFDLTHVPHVGSKLKALHKKYPSISLMLNGFKTTEGWTNTDLKNFKKEFDVFSSHIYVTEVSTSLITLAPVLNSVYEGFAENQSRVAMFRLIEAAKDAIHNPIPVPAR